MVVSMNEQRMMRELPPALRRQLEHSNTIIRNPLHGAPRLLVSTTSGLLFSSGKAFLSDGWVTFQEVTNHAGSMVARLNNPELFAQGVDIRIRDIEWCAEVSQDEQHSSPS